MARRTLESLHYTECDRRWAKATKRQIANGSVPLAPNTILAPETGDGGRTSYAVRFHGYAILRFHHDGRVVYHSHGYRTVTTKERMNRFGPVGVFQQAGQWYVSPPGGLREEFLDGYTYRLLPAVLPEFLTDTVCRLLAACYREDAYDTCPVLADALGDAGAPDELTAALRKPAPLQALCHVNVALRVHKSLHDQESVR